MNELPHIHNALPLEFAIRVGLPRTNDQGDCPISVTGPAEGGSPISAFPLREDPAEIGTVPGEQRTPDPREALDPVKRATVVALVRLGGSRRLAAREVGCCHRTIARAAARDPQFAAELAAAESRADGKALRLIDRATDQEKYWRAAAWVMERRNPEEYGRRAPHTFTGDQVMERFTRFLHVVMPKLPAECHETLLEEYENVLSDLTENPDAEVDKKKFAVEDKAPVAAPPPPEPLEKQCPRDEAAARAWLAGLPFKQLTTIRRRADKKPRRPDWNYWRTLVDETWERVYRQRCRTRREARRQRREENGRSAPDAPPLHPNGGS